MMNRHSRARAIMCAAILLTSAPAIARYGDNDDGGERLRLAVQKPRAGQTVSFDYSTAAGKLAGAKDIRGALFYYTLAKTAGCYAIDIAVSPAGNNSWKGRFTLPDSAVAFAVRLRSGKVIENNDGKGLVSPVYNAQGVKQGAYAGVALLWLNYGQALDITGRADSALALLEKEMAAHPTLKPKYQSAWYTALARSKKKEAYPVLDKKAQELLSTPGATADDYKLAMGLLQLQGKKKQADSVLQLAARTFPGSELALQYDDNRFYQLRDVDSMVLYYNDFNSRYPQLNPRDPAVQTSSWFAATIAARYINKKDYRKALKYTALIKDALADYRAYTYNWIAMNNTNDSSLALADSVIRMAMADLDAAMAHPDSWRREDTPLSEWKDDINTYFYSGLADTYAKILFLQKNYTASLPMQQKAVTLSKGKKNDINERYIKYLLAAGEVKKACEKAAGFIRESQASDSVKIWFRQAYVKEKGSEEGFDSYLSELQQAGLAKFRGEAMKEKLDLPSKAFSMKDTNGKDISLASLKGKVVVVDFWATWCGPCKASFPAMQMAVDKFKNDSNVVFLFVNTLESTPAAERLSEVKKFIQDHHYSFHVLLDNVVDLEKRQYEVVGNYGVGGIPTKFVIDTGGRIAFKSVGFDGNNEKLVNELSVYIDLAKKSQGKDAASL